MRKNTELYMKMRLGFTFINFLRERAAKQVIHTLISLFQIHPSGLVLSKTERKAVRGKNSDLGIQNKTTN